MTTVDEIVERVLREALLGAQVRRPERGTEYPAELLAVDGARVVVVLPAPWRWRGLPVQERDLPALREAVTNGVKARGATNRLYAVAAGVPVEVRRAVVGDRAWSAKDPHVYISREAPVEAPRVPTETRLLVRIGSTEYALGDDCDRHEVQVGKGRALLAPDPDNEGIEVIPDRLLVGLGRRFHAGPIRVGVGEFALHERSLSWWLRKPGRLLAPGEVILVGSGRRAVEKELGSCRVWGDGVEAELAAGDPAHRFEHGDAALELRLDPDHGVLVVSSAGRTPVRGRGPIGRVVLDRQLEAELLPGEIDEVDLAGKTLFLSTTGSNVARFARTVTLAPPGYPSRPGSIQIAPPGLRGGPVEHLGELLEASGVRAFFRAWVGCRVDGRPADVGDVLPVRPTFTLQYRSSVLPISA